MAREGAIAKSASLRGEYVIHGVKVRFNCGEPEAFERIDSHLSAYAGSGGAVAGEVNCDVSFGPVIYPVPLHAKRLLRYGTLRAYFLDGCTWFTDYFSTLKVEEGGLRVHGNLSPESFRDWGMEVFCNVTFTLALFEALRHHGLYYTHAAGLVDDEGVRYLVSGNAGSGKTSLTLSLIQSGLKFLSDDTVFFKKRNDGGVDVLGFARDFHVPLDLIMENEALEKYMALPDYRSYKKKKTLRPDEWFPGKRLDSMAEPDILLFPRLRDGESEVEPLDRAAALTELLPQSLSVMFQPKLAKSHLDTIGGVLKKGKAFRIWSGPELKSDIGKVKEVVETAKRLWRAGDVT